MSKKIGELLLQQGALTEEELRQALNAQLVYGGHLGTCLIEQGFVSETELGQALAKIYRVGYAGVEELTDIPGPIVECLPRKLVEKYAMIPFRVESGTLHLALINPRDVEALTQASCTTGFRAEAWVAPEIRIYQALERYYRIPRRLRFVALCRELDRSRPSERLARSTDRESSPAAVGPWPPPEQNPVYDLGTPTAPSASGESRGLEDLGAEFGYGQSWRDIADSPMWSDPEGPDSAAPAATETSVAATAAPDVVAPRVAPVTRQPVPAPSPPAGSVRAALPVPSVVTLETATDRLANARTTDDIASAFLDWAVTGTPRCLLWRVDGVTAILWDWRGFAVDADRRAKLTLKVTDEPVFRLTAGSTCYRGPVPPEPAYRGFFERVGADPPQQIELLPLHMDDRLVALFYGDSGTQAEIGVPTREFRRTLLKLGYSLWMLRLRHKILTA